MPKKKSAKKTKPQGSNTSSSVSIGHDGQSGNLSTSYETLIEQANAALSQVQPELAAQLYEHALTLSPSNTEVMDALADVKLQLGDMNGAKTLLEQSTSISRENNPYKWFYLAQLESGKQSVQYYKTGIAILSSLLPNFETEELELAKKQIAKAHCSIADIYMTDLCFEEEAEGQCEEQVAASLVVLPNNLEGLQTQASLRLSQCRKEEAAAIMRTVFERLSIIRRVVAARTVKEEIEGVPEPEEFRELPEMDFCIATVKLMIECGCGASTALSNELLEKAMELGDALIAEDDEIIELWYLIGVAAMSRNPADICCAKHYLMQAKAMMEVLKEASAPSQHAAEEFEYNDHYELVCQHLRMIEDLSREKSQEDVRETSQPMDEEWSDEGEAMAADHGRGSSQHG